MAYDPDLADRIRRLLGGETDLSERRMFGGLAFLICGRMAVAVSGRGGLMVRVDPATSASLVATTRARFAEMRGREMPGWLRVDEDDLRTESGLAGWVAPAVTYARTLPGRG